MMQKFGFHKRKRSDQKTIPAGVNTLVNMYAKNRLAEMKMQKATDTLKLEQPRAYYYQMIPPNACSEDAEDANLMTLPRQPRRTSSETMAVSATVPHLSSFMETMPFSRDSCSDTDSGICTDNGSECQQSPKYTGSTGYADQKIPASVRGRQPAIAILPTPSNFKIRHQSPCVRQPISLPVPHENTQSLSLRRGKQPLKVRFADELPPEEDFTKLPRMNLGHVKAQDSGHYYSMPPQAVAPPPRSRHESPPPLPDYEMAVKRMREIGRHQPHPRSQSLPRRPDHKSGLRVLRNPYYEEEDKPSKTPVRPANPITGSDKRLSEAKSLENLVAIDDQRAMQFGGKIIPSKSCENLKQADVKSVPTSISNPISIKQNEYLVPDSRSDFLVLGSKIPDEPFHVFRHQKHRPRFNNYMSSELQKIATNALHQESTMGQKQESQKSQTLLLPTRAAKSQSRMAALPTSKMGTLVKQQNYQTLPVNPCPSSEAELAKYHNEGEPLCTDRLIESRLIGLDHQGIQLVELRKRDDGPFGFYIATGSFKKKKGIFVSRITVRGLFPLLSVGDQILDVDFQPVKGRSLEDVQSMMSNTDRVILRTLPAIMR